MWPRGGPGGRRGQVEADRAVAPLRLAATFRRAEAAGGGDQREDADPATARDGVGRDRRAEGLSGDPAARRGCPDRVRGLARRSPAAALRLGPRPHEPDPGGEGRVERYGLMSSNRTANGILAINKKM